MSAVAPALETSSPVPEQVRWPLPLRIAFRFFCCYWLLFSLPQSGAISIFQAVPGGEWIWKPYMALWQTLCPWVAIHVFHLSGKAVTYFPTGSGDTTLCYVQQLLFVVVSAVATLAWSVLDRRRPNYRALYAWLRLLLRYTLAFTLFGYGFAKLFPLQFQPASLRRLIEPYHEFSPMGVLWSFMGASQAYTMFAGLAEVIPGLLLLFRRTTSLGAMMAAGVMLNVAALNYFYDVPVKLYSTNLLLMALFLLVPDLRRLAAVLLLNRASAPADLYAVRFERRWMRVAAVVFCVLFVGYTLWDEVSGGWSSYKQFYLAPDRPPIYGLYDVESGAPANWQRVIFERKIAMTIRTTDNQWINQPTAYDASAVVVNKKDRLAWSRPDAGHLLLNGTWEGAPASIHLRKVDTGKFLLPNRGFHWINETPFNK